MPDDQSNASELRARLGHEVIVAKPVVFAVGKDGRIHPQGTPEYERLKALAEAALLERPEVSE